MKKMKVIVLLSLIILLFACGKSKVNVSWKTDSETVSVSVDPNEITVGVKK